MRARRRIRVSGPSGLLAWPGLAAVAMGVGVGAVGLVAVPAVGGALSWATLAAPSVQQGGEPQSAALRAVAAVHPPAVRVGEPFVLGVTVRAAPGAGVAFPDRIELPEGLEQAEPMELRADPEAGAWRGYYRLVAWSAGEVTPPELRVRVTSAAGEGRTLTVRPPPVEVRSVLPESAEDLDLRGARPYLEAAGSPWWWVALGALLVALGLWWWRRRRARADRGPEAAEETERPAERALRELEAVRRRWEAGRLEGPAFFDEWSEVLRRYAAATRTWPAGTPLGQLANGDRELAGAVRRAELVRFARLRAGREAPPRATETAARFVRRERGREP